ncbi:hypothetical protein ACLOJK_009716 [Asimina triloba]
MVWKGRIERSTPPLISQQPPSQQKEAREAPLWQKPHLHRLVISMLGRDDDDDAERSKRMESILDSLKPHMNLEELKLFWYAGWNGLKALQTLEVRSCDELKSLPHGLKPLQSLENLIIFSCNKLEWLREGLGQLKKLKNLEVFLCKKLKALPHVLQDLSLLQRLSIGGCPLLSARCKRGGADWPMVSHVPNIIQ